MKQQSIKSVHFELSGGYYTIERAGQQRPCIGDCIIAKLTVLLPAESEYVLESNLQFGMRVNCMGEYLTGIWGHAGIVDGYKYLTRHFQGDKWSDVFKQAADYAETELQKLEDALIERAKAFVQADFD